MLRERFILPNMSEFMRYLAVGPQDGEERLPAIADLSRELGVSIASLREQLEVARALGLVEVRPRTGMRRLPYTFRPAVLQSLSYALTNQMDAFKSYSDLRGHIESAYWYEAVSQLKPEDHEAMRKLVSQAKAKLSGAPVQIPQSEHRELHLSIYCRLGNPFVQGLLEAYWDMYEAVGLNLYNDLNYLQRVWNYHGQMVEAIARGDFDQGFRLLREHMNLIEQRPSPLGRQRFE